MNYGSPQKFLNGKVNFPLCLAPMVGLSHVSMRALVRSYTPKDVYTLWPTEMLNSRRLPSEDFLKTPETMKMEGENGLTPQILGNEEHYISASVKKLKDWGAEAVDINMGCPVSKALKHNYGVALMGDPQYAKSVVEMTVRNTTLPVSVKLRAGHQNDFQFLLNFIKELESAGASWICLHPRTPEQKRRGSADWSQIKKIKDQIQIPVIGNGDIQVMEDVFSMLSQTNCDMVMAGRAFTARPWLMWQMGEKLGLKNPEGRFGRAPQDGYEEGEEFGRALKQLLPHMVIFFGESLALRKFSFYVKVSHPWLEFGHTLYAKILHAPSSAIMMEHLEQFFSTPQKMNSKTDLRQ